MNINPTMNATLQNTIDYDYVGDGLFYFYPTWQPQNYDVEYAGGEKFVFLDGEYVHYSDLSWWQYFKVDAYSEFPNHPVLGTVGSLLIGFIFLYGMMFLAAC